MHTCMHTYIYTYIHPIHIGFSLDCLPPDMTYIHTYIHAYNNIHFHTYTYIRPIHIGFSLDCVPPDMTRVPVCKSIILRNNKISDLEADLFWDSHFKMQYHRGLTQLDLARNR